MAATDFASAFKFVLTKDAIHPQLETRGILTCFRK